MMTTFKCQSCEENVPTIAPHICSPKPDNSSWTYAEHVGKVLELVQELSKEKAKSAALEKQVFGLRRRLDNAGEFALKVFACFEELAQYSGVSEKYRKELAIVKKELGAVLNEDLR